MVDVVPIIPELEVAPVDIVNGFKASDAIEVHMGLYRDLVDNRLTPSEYANGNSGGRSADANGYARALGLATRWLSGEYSSPIKAVRVLHSLGIFEGDQGDRHFDVDSVNAFSVDNPNFGLMTMLATAGFWSGSMVSRVGRSTAVGCSVISRQLTYDKKAIILPLAQAVASRGFLDAKSEERVNGGDVRMRLRGEVARFMAELSGIVGRKRANEFQFPAYVLSAIKTLDDANASEEAMVLAVKILQDFIALGVSIRGNRPVRSQGYRFALSTYDSSERAMQQAGIFERVYKKVFDGACDMHKGVDRACAQNGSDLYAAHCVLKLEDVTRLRRLAAERILEVI